MKTILKFVFCAFAFTAVTGAALAQGDILKSVEEARNLSDSALKQYNLALQKLDEAGEILDENQIRLGDLNGELNSLNARINANASDIKSKLNALSIEKENFSNACNNLENIRASLEFASSILPLGKDRAALGEKIYAECLDLVAKNPGSNNKDRDYFNIVSSYFLVARDNLSDCQANLSQVVASIGIVTPRIGGIKNFMDLSDSYLKQSSEKCEANISSMRPVGEELSKLIENSIASFSALNKQCAENRSTKNSYIKSVLKLDCFVMNKLPKIENGKYFGCVFKPGLDFSRFYLKMQKKFESTSYEKLKASAGADMKWGRPALSGVAKAKGDNSAKDGFGSSEPYYKKDTDYLNGEQENMSAEIWDKCTKLAYLTYEIDECLHILRSLLEEAEQSFDSISEIESAGQASLRGAIQAAADSQSIASEIEILKSQVEIAKAQSDIAAKRFETLGKEASQAREKTLEDIKGLDKIVGELNKLE